MKGSSQHKVAKWLDTILQSVLEHYSTNCIKDSFQFTKFIQGYSPLNKFVCSFDICRLFTCVPIFEMINICVDMPYCRDLKRSQRPYCRPLTPPKIPEVIFVKLMEFTTSVQFSFNNIMYQQIDGVSMGSPWGATMVNIFVGFHEAVLMSNWNRP